MIRGNPKLGNDTLLSHPLMLILQKKKFQNVIWKNKAKNQTTSLVFKRKSYFENLQLMWAMDLYST